MGIKLIVGLGNPGAQYEKTRHNVGFWLINQLAEQYHTELKLENKFKGLAGGVTIKQHDCKLLMPTTFMNLSGEAVQKLAHFYKILPEQILVAHDELDFTPGIARLKQGGGANGHNGIISIASNLNNPNFWRLRIGIGKPIIKDNMAGFVLSTPNKAENIQINTAIDQALTIIPELILGNFNQAIQKLHGNHQP